MHIDEFSNFMNKLGCEFCLNEPLSRHSSFKIGGLADVFIKPYDIMQLKSVLRFCREKDVPYVVIGNGSNILFKDTIFAHDTISQSEYIIENYHNYKWLTKYKRIRYSTRTP